MNITEFVRWAIENGSFEGTDLDGGSLQDKAEECGILVKVAYDPVAHGENSVGAEAGDDWYVFTNEFKDAEEAGRKR